MSPQPTAPGPQVSFPASFLQPGSKRRGGRRKGAGRKARRSPERRASHARREQFTARLPLHVTLRLKPGMVNLRWWQAYRAVELGLMAGRERFGFRLVHFAVLGNHIHLVAEAESPRALARGCQGLKVRLARGLNRLMARTGPVFGERYHVHVLRTPAEVRSTLHYV